MTRVVWRTLFVLILVALPITGCITDPVTGEKTVGMPMSDAEEVSMGNQYAPSFKAQYEGAYPDKELQRFCEKIVLDMAKASHRPSLPWNFTILNSSEVNAFALPGGTVCITRGLLHQLKNEAAFAGVMGHEVGHVTHKHAAQGMGRSTIFNLILAGAAVGVSQATDSEWAQLGLARSAPPAASSTS
jgi:predicted Zn-dependent protease